MEGGVSILDSFRRILRRGQGFEAQKEHDEAESDFIHLYSGLSFFLTVQLCFSTALRMFLLDASRIRNSSGGSVVVIVGSNLSTIESQV